jgi:hypothetical protein
MGAHRCSFCKKFSSSVVEARICPRCAEGRTGDKWCDFCNKTTNTDIAWICPSCAKGQPGDRWCDFCKKTTNTNVARICRKCSA